MKVLFFNHFQSGHVSAMGSVDDFFVSELLKELNESCMTGDWFIEEVKALTKEQIDALIAQQQSEMDRLIDAKLNEDPGY